MKSVISIRIYISILSVIVIASGCASRPLPGNVSKLGTYQIVQKIRCEVRDAIRAFTSKAAEDSRPDITAALRSGRANYKWFFETGKFLLSENDRTAITRYETAFIAYEFTFDITESNNVSANVDFLDAITRGTLKLGIGAENNRERTNLRNFKLADNFRSLAISPIMDRVCPKIKHGGGAFYPITGGLGMQENIGTFLNLNQSANLTGEDGFPTLSDTMTFTTELKGTVNPSVELNAVGSGLQLVGAGVGSEFSRKDIHSLVFAIALLSNEALAKKPGTTARERALDELNRQRAIRFQDDTVTIRDDLLGR